MSNIILENNSIDNILSSIENEILLFNKDNNNHRLEKVINTLLELINSKVNNPEIYFWLTYSLYIYDQDKEALKYFTELKKLDPQHKMIPVIQSWFEKNIPTASNKKNIVKNNSISSSNKEIPRIKSLKPIRRLQNG
ncbi:MAG: hypothetical protein U0457_07845 [Candidatus Sericytochromatia bacterium]